MLQTFVQQSDMYFSSCIFFSDIRNSFLDFTTNFIQKTYYTTPIRCKTLESAE